MDVPLVVFVNTFSGGLQGEKIIEKLKKCVLWDNIFDLSQGGPAKGLQKYKGSRFRVVVCGGDGSVNWVLSEIEKLKLPREITPPVAILPLGTGNDLSRVLKWGGSSSGKKLKSFIDHIEKACVVLLDKWKLSCEGGNNKGLTYARQYMNNYFSIGADAEIALQFHEMRLAHPDRFKTRAQNMAWYMRVGLHNLAPDPIAPYVSVEVNGSKVTLPEQTRCVLVLNLPSYAGGGNPWGTPNSSRNPNNFVSPAIDDGLLEVVAINGSLQLAAIHANIVRGKRLGQGNSVKITLLKSMSAQVDGEPWKQPASIIHVQHAGKSLMLANSQPTLPFSADALGTPPFRSSPPRPLYNADSANAAAATARVLLRTRSSSSPLANTPSPIKYGPTLPAKRKKNRQYCDGCGLEFYLPYMLANHLKSGLCAAAAPPTEDAASAPSPNPAPTSAPLQGSVSAPTSPTSPHVSLSSAPDSPSDLAAEHPRRMTLQLDDGRTAAPGEGGLPTFHDEQGPNGMWRSRSVEAPVRYEIKYYMDDDDEVDNLIPNKRWGTSELENPTDPTLKSHLEALQAHLESLDPSAADPPQGFVLQTRKESVVAVE